MSAYSMIATGSKETCVCVLFFVYSYLRDKVRSSCRIALLSVKIQLNQFTRTHVSLFYDCHRDERNLCWFVILCCTEVTNVISLINDVSVTGVTSIAGPTSVTNVTAIAADTSVAAMLTPFAPNTRAIPVLILTLI